ncbi:MAG TPA: tetratricopeptide repeat protein [Gemmatimonadales bacterium]
MALSEIEKLERRYAENPQGLTFAPLAEVHRKNGDITRALELLRPGLTLHPDYIPASIVLGRCHLDLGELPAAETAFRHVLELDGENVIALKALADIAERQSRFDDAAGLLNSLLSVDRSNDEARAQLARLEAAREQTGSIEEGAAAAVGAGAPAAASEPMAQEGARTEDAHASDAADDRAGDVEEWVEPASADSATAEASDSAPSAPITAEPMSLEPAGFEPAAFDRPAVFDSASLDAEPADLTDSLELETLDAPADELPEPAPEGLELDQAMSADEAAEPIEPIAGLVGRDEDIEASDHVVLDEFRVETSEDIVLESSGGREFQVANAAEELLGRGPEPHAFQTPEPAAEHEPAPAVQPEAAPEPQPEPVAAVEAVHEEPAAEPTPAWAPEPPPVPELVITESMAELLLQQGYRAEALTIYRHLAAGSPDDGHLGDRIRELEAADTPARPAPEPPPPPAEPARAWSARVTHGQPLGDFLRALLAARPPASAGGPVRGDAAGDAASSGGAPTRPAHDSLSLSSVFGEESAPNPPAVPATGAPAPGGVSFDEFFGSPSAPAASRPPRAPDPKSDDLDQFHAWLQNLKR